MMDFNGMIKEFSLVYPELKDVKLKIIKNDDYIGACNSVYYGEFFYIGKMRYKMQKTDSIFLTENDKNIMLSFLHEIAHAITPYYERKVKNIWIRMDHSDKFYKNFFDIVSLAYQKKFITKMISMSELKKQDEYKRNILNDRVKYIKKI